MEIEEVAAQGPDGDPPRGRRRRRSACFRSRRASSPSRSGSRATASRRASRFLQSLFRAYVETDASLAEINPLLVTKQGDVLALDAKMNFDDNALFRHPDIKEMRDLAEEDPLEVEASKFGLNYIKLDGNVGCMVNGAGLAMAHDGPRQARRRRARQLPRRRRRRQRGAGQERVPDHPLGPEREGASSSTSSAASCAATSSPRASSPPCSEMGLTIPVVVRLEGTNVDEGKAILRESGLEDHPGRRAGRRGAEGRVRGGVR